MSVWNAYKMSLDAELIWCIIELSVRSTELCFYYGVKIKFSIGNLQFSGDAVCKSICNSKETYPFWVVKMS